MLAQGKYNKVLALFKKFTNSEDKKRLLGNFLSLSGLQVFTYILPLITLPYLVRVLGVEKYGLVMFAQSFIVFFNILVDYGFNLSATREIAVNRDNKAKVTEIYSSVMTIKVLLLGASFAILSSIVFSVEKFTPDATLYLLTFLMVVGQALFPIWYFQGMERMKYITIITILSRVIFTVAIFVFVHNENDYVLVPVLNSLGACIGSVYALWLIRTSFQQRFEFQSLKNITLHFKDSTQFFLSRVAVSIYTSANTFVLGIFTDNTMVGYYSIAEKLYQAMQGLYGPITQAVYPYVAKQKNIRIFKKIFYSVVLLNIIGTIILFFGADYLFMILFGKDFGVESVNVFQLLLIANLIVVPSILVGYPLLAALGHVKYANMSVIYASGFHFSGLFLLYLTGNINIYIVAGLVVFTQSIDFAYRFYGVYKTKVMSI